ncbi:acyl-CoA/acyl-ACP dehydrogenase [Novosphingobium sp. ERN07]|uniref:acyl-CoA dehydrogenase family protein n=1 Tax=Novosphingobium sp. ERN07 TaxID=2726187 RepID=UPI0014575DFC|nr:acyl-CoA dehydrogenase family protein [Novosphingobium sp. ERN07]NLR72800.1 acyl-CoA/acyl-ACP dehydrogenase [Novosphingobium sp. ERN07]
MNFLLSPEQHALVDSVSGLLRDRCDALHVHQVFDTPGEAAFDAALWSALSELGVPAIMVPEAHGGLGLELIDLAIVSEALGRAAAPVPFLGHALAALAISLGGSEEQKERWLPALASGEKIATVAFGESPGRWAPDEWTLLGETLTGTKTMVPNAKEADLIVVGLGTGALAVVEKDASFTVARLDVADRTRPLDTVTFTDASAELLANGTVAAPRVFDAAAVLLAADAFGGADHCVNMSVEYAKIREQYGQPIAAFQGLRYQLVAMALATEPARGLYWFAAHAWDALPEKARHAAGQAKAHLAETYLQVTRDTVEAHGGIGFTWEHDTHIYMKRAMLDWAWLGTPSRHRQRAADLAGW